MNIRLLILSIVVLSLSMAGSAEVQTSKSEEAKEFELMNQFMEMSEMTWDVTFSKERVFNPEYFIKGIPYLAIIAPNGTVRHAALHPGDPRSDITGKVHALLEEFDLANH